MPPLGECERCHGPLCISSKRSGQTITGIVKCERCGHEHLEHPMTPAPLEPETPRAPSIPSRDFANSLPDRVAVLERQIKALADRVARLEQEAAQRSEVEHPEPEPVGAARPGRRR